MNRWLPLAFLVTSFVAPLSAAALADETPAPKNLPGVDGSYAIVTPPEAIPEPDQVADDNPLHRRIGDWDVTISGSVSVEIGFGDRPAGGRR